MANFSFDIVSEVDLQHVDDGVNQAKKELLQRYDFKGGKSSIEFDRKERKITLIADNDYKLKALVDILAGRFAKRQISIKFLDFKAPEQAFEGTIRQVAMISEGIEKEKAKELVKIIKDLKLKKVQARIEDTKLRVLSPSKDDLQEVMAHLKALDFSVPLNFTNYR